MDTFVFLFLFINTFYFFYTVNTILKPLKGVVSVLTITRLVDTLREWKQNRNESIVPTISIAEAVEHSNVQFNKWHAHKDWITEVFKPSKYKGF